MADNLLGLPTEDPTIAAVLRAYAARNGSRGHSRRVGGSSVGKDCVRQGYFSFRWVSPVVIGAKGLLAINDGHRSETVMADMLRDVPGVQLWTEQPETPGSQIEFSLVDGHFVGKLDGVVLGLLQAPVTPHVWEAKCVNETKFKKLKALVEKHGEKNALKEWDMVYFVQAQMYMHGMSLDRHYLTVATPGVRDMIGVRTEYQIDEAIRFEARAARIVYDPHIPARINKDPAFFGCKFCDHADVCHGSTVPLVNCRTCTHSTAINDGTWTCVKFGTVLTHEFMQHGCAKHRYNPGLVNAKVAEVRDNDDVVYELAATPGVGFVDSDKKELPPTPAAVA